MDHPNEYDPLVEGLFADNASIIAGGLQPELPTVAPITMNRCLFYKERTNEIHGEPGAGKTNVLTAAIMPVLALGKQVLYIDPEDIALTLIRKLDSFGCPRDFIISGLKHTTCPTPEDYKRLAAWAERTKPELVIIDGVAEVLAAEGLSEDKPDDFLKYFRERIKPFTDAGAAVVLADHVTKSTESRGRWARGTGAKMGRYDGVSYSIELGKGYSPTQAGFVRLKVAKDRNGGVGVIGQEIAEIHFTPKGEGKTSVAFREPANADAGRFIPTAIMEKVSRKLEVFPDSSLRDLRAIGKTQYVDAAIAELQSLGHIEVLSGGPGRPTKFTLNSQYREVKSDE